MENKKHIIFGFAILFIALLFLVLTFSNKETPKEQYVTNTTVETQKVEPKTNPITIADKKFVNGINDTLNNGYKVKQNSNVYYTKSKDFSSVYFVGALVENNGQIYNCIWATNDVAYFGAGLIFSINDFALTASGLGDGRTNREPITEKDDGYTRINHKLLEDMVK